MDETEGPSAPEPDDRSTESRRGRRTRDSFGTGRFSNTPVYRRSGPGLEFDRLATFCDGVFAISMTLIAATIAVPSIVEPGNESELLERLRDTLPNIVMFFVAFVIIGRYWIANHQFVSTLTAVNTPFMVWTLFYLAFVAFLPFPAALMGRFDDNAVAVSLFAVSMAAVSGMESVLIWQAHRSGLIDPPMDQPTYRWVMNGSLSPVVVFLLSVPLMFIHPWLGITSWTLTWVWQRYLGRRAPTA